MTQQPAPRRARHLMDPDNPRPAQRPGGMGIEGVQKWVLSALAATTILHLSVGLVVSAVFVDESQDAARIGLNLIASAFGVIAFAVALAIHKKSILSPWLLLGLVPGAIGLWICYG
ncbi:hypothetical protein [Nocardioides dongkuii]|uniref:hypothetical protein n=1 Tax=Nocardioides dongkuii TaxID=2760089 RepID=UPI0015FADBAA|nr:hypothetical protein [Nocardioides dongkuii]